MVPPWEIKREEITRVQAETDPRYGYDPYNRPIEQHIRFGLMNLDKPAGPSSHEVVAWVKRMLQLKHAGHGGTLEDDKSGETRRSPASCRWRSKTPQKSFRPFCTREKNTSA